MGKVKELPGAGIVEPEAENLSSDIVFASSDSVVLIKATRAKKALANVRKVLGASTGVPCGADDWLNEISTIAVLLNEFPIEA